MACYRPLTAYRAPGGGLTWARPKSDLLDRPLELPCGQCRVCRMNRARDWALRIMHEAMMHDKNSFITLTYSVDPVSLNVKHWQDFMKRLRKQAGPVRFFHCGEYGEVGGRAHYHACMFGIDFSDDRRFFKGTKYGPLYSSEVLSKTWGKGFCSIGALTYESAEYVSRYVMKKQTGQQGQLAYADWTGHSASVVPPYVTMSRGGRNGTGGIGASWFDRYSDDVYPSDEVIVKGRRFRPPRYYDDSLSSYNEKLLEELKKRRLDAVSKRSEELTPARLRTREKVDLARDAFFTRSI